MSHKSPGRGPGPFGSFSTAVTGVEDSGELWVTGSNPDQQIRIRYLTDLRKRGVTVIGAQLVEQTDETWLMWVRLSDRQGEFRLNLAKVDEPRRFRDVHSAFFSLRDEMDYWGPVTCSTERRRPLAGP